jgi:hypothetical protein
VGVVVHDCNPFYLEGRGRRTVSMKPVQAKLVSNYLKSKILKTEDLVLWEHVSSCVQHQILPKYKIKAIKIY